MEATDNITTLAGVGDKMAARFLKLGISNVGDLVSYYPKDYECYEKPGTVSDAIKLLAKKKNDEEENLGKKGLISIYGMITEPITLMKKGSLTIGIANCVDVFQTKFQLTFYNMPYIRSIYRSGQSYVFRGRLSKKSRKYITLEQPEVIPKEKYDMLCGKLMPIYALTSGISRNLFMKCMQQILDNLDNFRYNKYDIVPDDIVKKYAFIPKMDAIRKIHFPKNNSELALARKRLVFEEFFSFSLKMQYMKDCYAKVKNKFPDIIKDERVDALIRKLPYELTNCQKKVLEVMRNDITGAYTMHRIVQGDVGSGKTILAFLTLYEVSLSGYQGFLMAPTEVLARQHYEGILKLFHDNDIQIPVGLLVGSMKASEKKEICKKLEDGTIKICIGTHALFQEQVHPENLALVITDEQHRFGVEQREAIISKGTHPHVCVMSATPIPRTLGNVIYGDLDISILDEKPAKRLPIKSCVVDTSYRKKAYQFIENQIKAGHQAYVVCPMVEESELLDGCNVIDYAKKLTQLWQGKINVGILHGRMKPKEKEEIMQAFLNGDIDCLVSTVVIEVGVDVANATTIMIEDAQRFGLAQLHQLRGRVGRGDAQSYCIFVQTDGETEENARLSVLNQSDDGFYIAEEDLKLRGPGQAYGTRQSGELTFALGDLYSDLTIFQNAVYEAGCYYENLPEYDRAILYERLFPDTDGSNTVKALL